MSCFGGNSAAKAEKDKDLKRNVTMTEHEEELSELIARLNTSIDTVSYSSCSCAFSAVNDPVHR